MNVSNFSGLGGAGTNWYQFDTTFQTSNVLAYNHGRITSEPASICGGSRPAGTPRTIRVDASTSPAISPGISVADFMLGLPRTVIHADRPDSGPRRRLEQRLLHQRQLAGVAKPDVESRAAIRAQLAGADLCRRRGAMLDDGLPDDHPLPTRADYPVKGFQFTEPNNKDWAPGLGVPPIGWARRPSLRAGSRHLLQPATR